MKQKIIISSAELKSRACSIIQGLPLDVVHSVSIQEHKRNRSQDQNSLLWKWYTIIGNELGESKEEMHEQYKEMFLMNIYERDNPEYAEMLESLRAVYRVGLRVEAMQLRKRVSGLTSTTTATVAQMSEYMQAIERHAAGLAIVLPCLEY